MKNNEIFELVKENFDEALKIRRHIHHNPELSFQEFNTAKFIREKLSEYGIEYKILANTGTVAHIGSGDDCVALRADIDALPIFEETGLEFKSQNDGVMHACGHDMHTTMLLIAAKILKQNEDKLNGIVKLIFQPAEEKLPGGASIMIEEGALENPKASAIFGQHIYPDGYKGTISIASGPILASADELYWTIKGKSTHAAQPHSGGDAILASAQIINYCQSLITKFRNPLDSGVLSVTSIHGGTATNIFPNEVKMMGTFRAYNNEWRFKIHKLLEENCKKIAELYACECEIDILKGYPPLVNNSEISNFAMELSKEVIGESKSLIFEPKMWAEDFAFYAEKIPACFWLLGINPSETDIMPPLHSSILNPSEDAMISGISLLIASAYNYLNKSKF